MGGTSNDDKEMRDRFDQLYHEKFRSLLGFAVVIFHQYNEKHLSDGKIEEVVQDTFLLGWEKRDEMFASGNPGGWLYNTLRFKVLERIREEAKWQRAMQTYDEHSSFPGGSNDPEWLDIQSIVGKDAYQLLYQIYIEGQTYKEMCEKLHISKSALASRIHDAKRKIRDFLK